MPAGSRSTGSSFDLDGYRSTASRPEGGADTFVTAGLVNDSPTAEDILNFADVPNSLPNINVVIPPSQLGLSTCPAGTASKTNAGYCSYTSLMNSGFLNNNKYWSTHYVGLNGYSVHDEITGFTLDGAWDVDAGVFDKLLFGGGYTRSRQEPRRQQQRLDQRLGPVRHALSDGRLPRSVQPVLVRLSGVQRHLHGEPAELHEGRRRLLPEDPAAAQRPRSCSRFCRA